MCLMCIHLLSCTLVSYLCMFYIYLAKACGWCYWGCTDGQSKCLKAPSLFEGIQPPLVRCLGQKHALRTPSALIFTVLFGQDTSRRWYSAARFWLNFQEMKQYHSREQCLDSTLRKVTEFRRIVFLYHRRRSHRVMGEKIKYIQSPKWHRGDECQLLSVTLMSSPARAWNFKGVMSKQNEEAVMFSIYCSRRDRREGGKNAEKSI